MGLVVYVNEVGSDNPFALDVGFLEMYLSLHLMNKKARMTSENILFCAISTVF